MVMDGAMTDRSLSRAPGDLRPALRDPTATKALARAHREQAGIPVSQRYAPSSEPAPPVVDPLAPWETLEEGEALLAAVTARLAWIEGEIAQEKAAPFPNAGLLKLLGREKLGITLHTRQLKDRVTRLRHEALMAERAAARVHREQRMQDMLGNPASDADIMALLLTALHDRIDAASAPITDYERALFLVAGRRVSALGVRLDGLYAKEYGNGTGDESEATA